MSGSAPAVSALAALVAAGAARKPGASGIQRAPQTALARVTERAAKPVIEPVFAYKSAMKEG